MHDKSYQFLTPRNTKGDEDRRLPRIVAFVP
jgi:hypothetical protein